MSGATWVLPGRRCGPTSVHPVASSSPPAPLASGQESLAGRTGARLPGCLAVGAEGGVEPCGVCVDPRVGSRTDGVEAWFFGPRGSAAVFGKGMAGRAADTGAVDDDDDDAGGGGPCATSPEGSQASTWLVWCALTAMGPSCIHGAVAGPPCHAGVLPA